MDWGRTGTFQWQRSKKRWTPSTTTIGMPQCAGTMRSYFPLNHSTTTLRQSKNWTPRERRMLRPAARTKTKGNLGYKTSRRPPVTAAGRHLSLKAVRLGTEYRKGYRIRPIKTSRILERAMGIEPTSEAWEA